MKWIILSDELPGKYGKYPGARPIEELLESGFIILDKWAGPTSHDTVASVKKTLKLSKAGHSGTLDPKVTGILPTTLENGCKVMPVLQGLTKEYVGIMELHSDNTLTKIKQVAKEFVGSIRQTPPVRSAVKRRERTRKVYSFEILEMNGKNVLFRILCEAGTYVRMICHKIGEKTGGAHMKELRRTKVGRFTEDDLVKMQDLADSYESWKKNKDEKIRDYILPIETTIEHIGKVIIKDSAVYSTVNGSPLYAQGISKLEDGIEKNDLVAILTLKGELIAIGKAATSSKEIKNKRLAVKIDRVIMKKGIYPKMN